MIRSNRHNLTILEISHAKREMKWMSHVMWSELGPLTVYSAQFPAQMDICHMIWSNEALR